MGQKLPPHEKELYKRCDEVLHYIWDPIGVAGAPGARDEYDTYLSGVFTLVRDNADPTEIVEYLTTVVEQRMGIAAQPDRTRRAVDVMIEWRKWIWDIKSDP